MGCCSTAMGGMPLSGQAWPGAAAAFLAMWMVMMVPMMLPSLVPMLWRYRKAVSRTGGTHLAGPTALVGAGYFLVWVGVGVIAFPLGAALAEVEMRQAALAGAVPFAAGGVVLIAGALQFTAWKRRRLACCREAPGADGARGDAVAALRHGVHLGLRCGRCCLNLMLVGLVLGSMDLGVMAAVTAAITAERVAPSGERVARITGAVVVAAGVLLMARAAGMR